VAGRQMGIEVRHDEAEPVAQYPASSAFSPRKQRHLLAIYFAQNAPARTEKIGLVALLAEVEPNEWPARSDGPAKYLLSKKTRSDPERQSGGR